MNIECALPNGQNVAHPSADLLRDFVFRGTAREFNTGSGSLDISLGPSSNACLMLILHEPVGWCVQYLRDDPTDPWVAVSSNDFSHTVQVPLAGEPWQIPLAFIVSRDAAWDIIEHFAERGTMSPNASWVRVNEQTWNSGY